MSTPIVWGLVLGFGSSLHCAGMCGPIGCSLLLATESEGRRHSLAVRLAAMHLGRVASYAALGFVFGMAGASVFSRLDFSALHLVMQWTAAALIIWLGLSTAGFVPAITGLDRALSPVAGSLARLRMGISTAGPETAFVSGMVWGLTPCAMVYGALFNSLLTGNAADGAAMMLAFGLGTIPAAAASGLALYKARRNRLLADRRLAGGLMIGGGVLALLLTTPGSPLCITH